MGFLIIFAVFPYLFRPPFCARFRNHKIFAAFMSVPETSVDKNDGFVFRQNNVRFSRQGLDVYPVPEPFAEKVFPYEKLGLGVLCPDLRHIVAAGFFGVDVGHEKDISLFSKVLFISVISNLCRIEIIPVFRRKRQNGRN